MHSAFFMYDLAMYDRIHSLYDETYYASPDEQFIVNAREHQGQILMPFIGIYRLPDFSISRDVYNDSQVRRGWTNFKADNIEGVEFSGKPVKVHSLPVTLQYQIDVYATKRDVCDGMVAELLMEFFERPYLRVNFMDIGNKIQEFQVNVDDSVTDNTDISGFNETNRFYRLSFTLEVDHAYIYRVDEGRKVEKIIIHVDDLEPVVPGKDDNSKHGDYTDGISPGVRSYDEIMRNVGEKGGYIKK